jgi:peptide/nickel transport system permease protein
MKSRGGPKQVLSLRRVGVLIPGGLFVLAAFVALILPLPSPTTQNLGDAFRPPAWAPGGAGADLLGTDELGRDILSRLLAGARLDIMIAMSGVILAGVIGSAVGLVAGYYRNAVGAILARVIDAQLALPFLLVAMAIVVARSASVGVVIFILVVIGWAQYARVVRGDTMVVAGLSFVGSLRVAGIPTWRVLARHVLPNVTNSIVVVACLEFGTLIIAESALSFLGLGVGGNTVTLGSMLAEGQQYLGQTWWLAVFPGAAISLLALTAALAADVVRRSDAR